MSPTSPKRASVHKGLHHLYNSINVKICFIFLSLMGLFMKSNQVSTQQSCSGCFAGVKGQSRLNLTWTVCHVKEKLKRLSNFSVQDQRERNTWDVNSLYNLLNWVRLVYKLKKCQTKRWFLYKVFSSGLYLKKKKSHEVNKQSHQHKIVNLPNLKLQHSLTLRSEIHVCL